MTWETVPLGEIVDLRAGVAFPPALQGRTSGSYPFAKVADVAIAARAGGRVADARNWVDEEDLRGLRATPIPVGAVLFAKIGESVRLNARASAAVPLLIDNNAMAAIPGPRVDARYLYQWMRTVDLASIASTTSIPSVRKSDLQRVPVPLPPLTEQRRIAAILDEADALLTRAQAGFASFVEVRDAAFRQSTQTSATVALGAVSRMYGGSSLPEGEPFFGQADGYLCLKVSDMNRRDNEAGIANSSSWSASPGSRASTAPAGAVVIPKRGGAIGTNKKMQLLRPAILDPNLMAIEADNVRLFPATLLAWFKTIDLKTIQSGSSVPQLNKQDLVPLEVPIPPPDVQEDFSLSMSELSDSEASSRRRVVLLGSLFASLQDRAFRGEL